MAKRLRVALSANSSWNIVNFRAGLIRALSSAGYRPLVIAPIHPHWSPRVTELGVELWPLELDRSGRNPLADLRLAAAYVRLLRRIRPAAILSFTVKPNIYGCIAARLQGVPAVPNISGLGVAFSKRGPLRLVVTTLYRFALKRAPVVFFQNEDDLEMFVKRGIINRRQARRLPGSGVDLDQFTEVALPRGRPTFLLVARLLNEKGVRAYVDAARILRAEGLDGRWQLLGPIDEENPTAISRSELHSWIAEGIIDYLGEAVDVRPFIRGASVLVLPSTYPEGVPRALLEGAATGRPLITTDTAGCRDVVVEGVNGHLCPPKNAVALAAAMRGLAKLDHARLQAMGRESRRLAEARFDERIVTQAYLDALEQLLR